MNLITRLNIGARLSAAFALLLLLLAAVALIGTTEIREVNRNVEQFAGNIVPSLKAIDKLRTLVGDLRRIESQHLLVDADKEKDGFEARIDKTHAAIAALTKDYEKLAVDDQERSNLQAVQSALTAYGAEWKKVQPLSRASAKDPSKAEEARKVLFGESRKAYGTLNAAVEAMWAYNEKLSDAAEKEAAASYRSALWWMGGAAAFAVLLGVGCALLITRSITRPVRVAMDLAERIGAGDLTAKVQVKGRDETAQLLGSLDRMNKSLVTIVGQVRASSDSIATGSAQIATGNADLSQRTEEQASNLQQTAASMEQLTSTVKQNADTARQATQLASGASTVAAEGGNVVGQVVATMQEISESSKKIADIIGVIDGIAFQTNILALNAAVEAARAGEQGRGFAVVAGEVRTLAARSAQAAKEIKTLIGQSVEKVDAGSKLCDEAGRTMGDIVSQVKRVTDLIGEISSASVEQSQGIEQVGDAVSQLDQVTQQNAALVEESAAAADSLKVQAAHLAQTVATFRLAEGDAVQTAAAAPAGKPAAAARPAVVRRPVATAPARAKVVAATASDAKGAEKADTKANADWAEF